LNPHILPFRFEIGDIVGSFRNTRFYYGYFPPKRQIRSSIRRVIFGHSWGLVVYSAVKELSKVSLAIPSYTAWSSRLAVICGEYADNIGLSDF
jgi:hypothetical protein